MVYLGICYSTVVHTKFIWQRWPRSIAEAELRYRRVSERTARQCDGLPLCRHRHNGSFYPFLLLIFTPRGEKQRNQVSL